MTASSEKRESRLTSMGIGAKVLLVLAVLTAVEYLVAISKPAGQIPLIFLIAIAKAVLIVLYFMHVKQLWKDDHA